MKDWDDLKFILALGRAKGLSGAARLLGVNHATISRRIAAAEAKLGARLFDRLPTGLEPTEAGLQAIEIAERVEAQILELELTLSAKDQSLSGPLRVTAPQLLIQYELAGILADFTQRHPDIELTVLAANEILNLHRREADIAIRMSSKPEPTLFGRILTGQYRGYYASKDYVDAFQDQLRGPDSKAKLDYVSFLWWGEQPPKEMRDIYPSAKTSVRMDDMTAVMSAARAGMGIARMPLLPRG